MSGYNLWARTPTSPLNSGANAAPTSVRALVLDIVNLMLPAIVSMSSRIIIVTLNGGRIEFKDQIKLICFQR